MKFCYNISLPFLNSPKDLDLSNKKDLDFWDCFGRKKLNPRNKEGTDFALFGKVLSSLKAIKKSQRIVSLYENGGVTWKYHSP